MRNGKRILVRGVNWIGDAVMSLPAVRVIRSAFPDSDIHMMVKKWVEPIFTGDPNIDGVIEYRKEYEGVTGKLTASRLLRSARYDSAILLQNAFDAAILSYLAGIPERAGYSRDARGFLLTDPVTVTNETRRLHNTLYYLNLMRELGLDAAYRHPWVYMGSDERASSESWLGALRRPVVLLNPGATYGSAKRWPPEHFSSLAGKVIRELNGSVVLTGSESERPVAGEILRGIGRGLLTDETTLDISGRTSLKELISIISGVDIVVTNDSGPMHLAYAVGTPLVALFGSTDPVLSGPPSFVKPGEYGFMSDIEFGVRDIVLRREVDCGPCFERECRKGDVGCLRGISPDEVYDAVLRLCCERRAVFFDRDGTLCRDANYLSRMGDLEVYPDIKRIKELKGMGYLIIGVSNQSGIARGIVERGFTEEVNSIFTERYGFNAFYYCPHHPDEHCACRKPSPGMALKARKDFGIDLRSSIVVGDKESDMEFARGIGAEGILLRRPEEAVPEKAAKVFDTLGDAVNYMVTARI